MFVSERASKQMIDIAANSVDSECVQDNEERATETQGKCAA